MNERQLNKLVRDIEQTYYKAYKQYGNLTLAYDAPKIYAITVAELAAQGMEADAAQLATTIEGNIITGAYKLDTEDNVLVYLFFAAVIIWVFFYYKNKMKKG
jgi:hypothetical protein